MGKGSRVDNENVLIDLGLRIRTTKWLLASQVPLFDSKKS